MAHIYNETRHPWEKVWPGLIKRDRKATKTNVGPLSKRDNIPTPSIHYNKTLQIKGLQY